MNKTLETLMSNDLATLESMVRDQTILVAKVQEV